MKKLLIIIFSLIVFTPVFSQGKDTTGYSRFETVQDSIKYAGTLFKDDFPINITLTSNFTRFIKPKYNNKYMPAVLIVHLPDNDSIVKNILIKARGKSRKNICYFPPIKLNFKTDPLLNPKYKDINKIKMVSYCKANKIYNDYILKEYLIYKLYNLMTDQSFKVRLLKIDYRDTGKKGLNESRYGFVIEPHKALAERVNAVEIKTKVVTYNELIPLSADRVALFNYMIGNTDWQYSTSHNLKFIKMLDVNKPGAYVIPYVFDFSGFVNTDYAAPQEWSGVEKVTDRDYMGFCRHSEDNFNILKKEFLAAEDKVYETTMNFEPLNIRVRKQAKWYIETFYKELKYKNAFNIISANCRSPY